MKTGFKIIGVAILIAVAFVGWRMHEASLRARRAGLISENIVHEGDTWKADFTARIPAPEAIVFATMRDVEKAHNDHVKSVKIVSESGNSKTVQMDLSGFGGQTMTVEMEFHYFPGQRKITYRTLSSPMMDAAGAYVLNGGGGGTRIDYSETVKRVPNQFPEAVVKEVIRAIFVAQLEALEHALHISTAAETDTGDQEPVFPASSW
ncbi:MAG: SRPBCC family protein [Candidatus Binataceae bacterium]